jgi:hypothetical protein
LSTSILIIGEPGTGKSTSIETLNPEETFIINVGRKDLPFKGWRKNYETFDTKTLKGNYLPTDNASDIIQILKWVSANNTKIKTIIIDDFQYIMANHFMRRVNEKGFQKFNDLAHEIWSLVEESKKLRDDIKCYFLTHSEIELDVLGNKTRKAKTLGKLIDNVLTLEGMFTIVLYSDISKNKESNLEYKFITQNDGSNTGKSPRGMFETLKIQNDLQFVNTQIDNYYK